MSPSRCLPLLTLLGLTLALVLFTMSASAEQRVHTVASGHTLGKIAKRYRVSIDQLCAANGIQRNARLKVGQRIIIPDEPATSRNARRAVPPPADRAPEPASKPAGSKHRAAATGDNEPRSFTTHRVAPGHTLAKIAKRYLSDVPAIREANQLPPGARLRVGQCLKVPLTARSPQRLRGRRLPCLAEGMDTSRIEENRMPPNAFQATPDRPGVVRLVRGGISWSGRVLDRRGTPIPEAVEKIDQLLFDRNTGDTHSTNPRLLEMLVEISDHFGGRTIRIVSGYREESSNRYTTRSNHALGRAVDITVEGVPNQALRDFCQTFEGAGVGYYPNSTFVHVDARSVTTHWTDESGPGEPPRYTSVRAPSRPRPPAQ